MIAMRLCIRVHIPLPLSLPIRSPLLLPLTLTSYQTPVIASLRVGNAEGGIRPWTSSILLAGTSSHFGPDPLALALILILTLTLTLTSAQFGPERVSD